MGAICVASIAAGPRVGAAQTGSGSSADEGESLHSIPFITVRNKTGFEDPVEYFGDERSTMRAGYCNVRRTDIASMQSIADNAPFYVPDSIARLISITERPLEDMWRALAESSEGRRPVFYTHGYYIDFERGCKRASLFRDSLRLADRFVLFSWPSDGAILNYTRDESDLYWSVAPLTDVLADMVRRFGTGGVDLTSHSLGTRGVMLALARLAGRDTPSTPLFNQLVLLAPDIDVGIFEQYLPAIRPLVRNVTIYASPNDKALTLSRQVHGYPRLGEAGLHLNRLSGVEIVDLSELDTRSASGHVYHLYHDAVIEDLSELLHAGKTAAHRKRLRRAGANRWLLVP